jgi:threonine dehydrogenase-like Zn-dependent dehydrogenase
MCQAGLANHCRKRTVMGIAGRDGCFADFVVVPERNLHEVPDNISDEEAVFIEPLAAACQVRAQCPMDARSRVAVVGPGKLGLLVLQVLARTGCRLTAIGRNRQKLLICEKQGIQAVHIDELIPQKDHDIVVECTGAPEGLQLALQIVRPRGTIVLKSTYADPRPADLAPVVVDEVTILGSRCGPFGEAIRALERKDIDVRPLVSRVFPLDQFEAALTAAQDPSNIKILLKINSPGR